MRASQGILATLLVLLPIISAAYELGTHARMTRFAYSQSELFQDSSLLDDLGLTPEDSFDNEYYRLSTQVESRVAADFTIETPFWAWDSKINLFNPIGWFVRGAIREDDHIRRSGRCNVNAPNPQNEPGLIDRPFYHFFDPTAGDLSRAGLLAFDPAINWGLGTSDALQVPVQPEPNRLNRFTLQDAREAQYRALTGLAINGNTAIGPDGESADTAIRNAYWATTFQILGGVVHLVEDMAQPQHIRNDPHSGACFEPFNLPFGQTISTTALTCSGRLL